jgi:hypothetical protein
MMFVITAQPRLNSVSRERGRGCEHLDAHHATRGGHAPAIADQLVEGVMHDRRKSISTPSGSSKGCRDSENSVT